MAQSHCHKPRLILLKLSPVLQIRLARPQAALVIMVTVVQSCLRQVDTQAHAQVNPSQPFRPAGNTYRQAQRVHDLNALM